MTTQTRLKLTNAETKDLRKHALSAFLPEDREAIGRIKESMQQGGYDDRHPILMKDGLVLDGWHRVTAAKRAGVGVEAEEIDCDDAAAVALVLRDNLYRRHLTDQQRVQMLLAAADVSGDVRPSTKQIAASMGVSAATVTRAARLREAAPDLADKVAAGEMKPIEADRVVKAADDDYQVELPATYTFTKASSRRVVGLCKQLRRTPKQVMDEAIKIGLDELAKRE